MSGSKSVPDIIRLDTTESRHLASGQIHLYVVSITGLQADAAELTASLTDQEVIKAGRLINPEHGRRQQLVRGLLRRLSSRYLGIAPQEVEFDYAGHGKPYLRNDPRLHFNLSHSRDMAAFAFRLDNEIGVDIEYMRPQKNLEGMIRHVASAKEQLELNALTGKDADEAFYRLWTRKEAFIKAVGRGLGMGLRAIYIGGSETDSPLAVEYKNETQPAWFVLDLQPPQGYKLALCSVPG